MTKNLLKLLTLSGAALTLVACSSNESGSDTETTADSAAETTAETTAETEAETEETTAENDESSGDTVSVVATTTQVADLAEQIGGDNVDVVGLMGPGIDPHGYSPSPSDVETMADADVVAYNGLHLEAMFVDTFEEMEASGKTTIALEDAVTEADLISSDEEDLEYDPHIWFDVSLWQQSAQYMAEQLGAVDPDNQEEYLANAEAYIEELDELDTYITERVQEVPEESRYLVTAHDAFSYFGESYGFEVVGIQGLNSQTEAGTGDINDVANLIVENNVNAVFVESSVSDRNVQALVEAVEAQGGTLEIGGELYSDSLGTDEEGAGTYIDMYKTNIDTIVDALS